jgi:prolyl oligopeptidase PreP (S9A serine peptidase family)
MINILDLIESIYSSYEGEEFNKVIEKVKKVKKELRKLIDMKKRIPYPWMIERRVKEIQNISTSLIIEWRKDELEKIKGKV